MARIITKELAEKIVHKLGAMKSPLYGRKSSHDLYDFEHEGVLIAQLSLRRGSGKDQGHDYLSRDLHLTSGQAKRLGQCPLSLAEYLAILRKKGLLGDAADSVD